MTDSKRVLCLDIGTQRIGVAVSDPLGLTAQVLPAIVASDAEASCIALDALFQRYAPVALVVGMPLQLDGREGPAARRTRQWLRKVAAVIGSCPVIEWDERLTTVAAERALLEGNVSRRKRKDTVDSVAAALILQAYLGSPQGRS